MKYNNWDIGVFDRNTAVEFYREGVNPLVSVLLASRGITDVEAVQALICTDFEAFHDPYLMTDIDKAVSRIKSAINLNERIAVFGDYDVDGMTATTILVMWLRSQNAVVDYYIPGRSENDGYGLNQGALDKMKSDGFDLVITVDCGITAIEEAKYAKSIGLDLIITDHHECRNELPDVVAVINPKRNDCNYPDKALAGVGVAFKLICALEGDFDSDNIFNKYGEFVAVGTVADVMPVSGENRLLIRRGLNILRSNPSPGLRSLLSEAGADPAKVNSTTIGYVLAPRLNAAGRMGEPELSVKLLLTDCDIEAQDFASQLCKLNAKRRDLELRIYEEALALSPDIDTSAPVIIAGYNWHQGVTGIVASKMVDEFRVPVIVISVDERGVGRGSCRSTNNFNIHDAVSLCEDILDNYGGHDKAAGITISEQYIDEFRRRITDDYKAKIGDNNILGLELDFEVEKPELLTIDNIRALDCLEPFGNDNPSPRLCLMGAELSSTQSIGDGKHSRLKITKNGTSLDCIFFSVPAEKLGVSNGMLVDVAFEPQVNEFRGRSSVQLQLCDIRQSHQQ